MESIPFTDVTPTAKFLNVYKLNYKELHKFAQSNPFPLGSNKLLKLCISLGNLFKSYQLDEEMHNQSKQQQNTINNKLGIQATGSYRQTSSSSNPFESPKHFLNSNPTTTQPLYQIKFIKNLLVILKNFDIGFTLKDNSQSSTTLNQYANSPIKLNSRQLLIEKLEINITLDTLFIFKNLLMILAKILGILRQHLIMNNELGLFNTTTTSVNSSINEQSSIFSSNSASSNSSDSFISIDEYVKILNQILGRLSNGLIEPFLKYMLTFVRGSVQSEFKTLITSL
ncbi:hypothetical protein CANTEDRAFT_132053 [Yamadazyma tenuis ATCC 10573]|nr:uncharacterized protein CANTEDRAFT_132053 [Yamadazyma tenuis ATCC 10573]EGV60219.1 hypothetical protein CANTEDRAFT_132053 [Yamadazyma tenuis ATCC 10573]